MALPDEELEETTWQHVSVNGSRGCIRLRGIPFGAGKQEICEFFHGRNVCPEDVTLQQVGRRHIGAAWVLIPGGKKATQEAIEQLRHRWMGNRYIELYHTRKPIGLELPSTDASAVSRRTAHYGPLVRYRGGPERHGRRKSGYSSWQQSRR